jgi:hypothetical protein
LDTKSLDAIRKLGIPRTENSLSKFFTPSPQASLRKLTGNEEDRERRADLFPKMTLEEYQRTRDQIRILDLNFEYLKLKDITDDMKDGMMSIANCLAMHTCRWLNPDSMLESRNSPINSRLSMAQALASVTIIKNNPTNMAGVPSLNVVIPTACHKATMTHFEEDICFLARQYQEDFKSGTSRDSAVLPVTSVGDEPPNIYRRRFSRSVGWRSLMELVISYFGTEKLLHPVVNGFVLTCSV